MKRKHWIVTAALLTTLTATPALAKGPGRGHRPGPGFGGPPLCPARILDDAEMVEALGLTEEQILALRDLDNATGDEARRIRGELEALHLDMECAFNEATVDKESVQALAAEITDLQAQRLSLDIESRIQLRTILGADQHQALKSLMEQKRPRRPMQRR